MSLIEKVSNGKACSLCSLQSYSPIEFSEHTCQFDINYFLRNEFKPMNISSPEEIKLGGSEQNMLRARFREIFKSGAGHLTSRINPIIKECPNCTSVTNICSEHTKVIIPMIDTWIVKLTEASFTPKVLAQSARVFRDDITKNLSEKEANLWKAKSREYVVKEPTPENQIKVVKSAKAKGIDPIALIQALKEQGLTKEQIIAKLGLKV